MDESKEQLRLLIDFFTGPFQASHQHAAGSSSSSSTSAQDEQGTGDHIRSAESMATSAAATKAPISRQDINLIIRSLELCKKNFTHFSNTEKSYLLPLMTLCSHVLLSETNQIPRSSLATVSDILIYILQFLLNELSAYSDEEANFNEFNAAYYRKLRDVHSLSLDSEEYYRYLLKYRITKFLNFMLIGDSDKYEKAFFTSRELYSLCQMLALKPLPDSLRCHSASTTAALTTTSTSSSSSVEQDSSTRSFPVVVTPGATASISSPSFSSSTKRIRLTQPVGSLDRNSKEEFFDQLLTPFIVSSNSNISPPPALHPPPPMSSSSSSVLSSGGHSSAASSSHRYHPHQASFGSQPPPPPLLPPGISGVSSAHHHHHHQHQQHSFDSNMDDLSGAGTKTSTSSASKSHAAQIKSYLISHNQMYFQYAGGANTLLNLVNSYTILRPYILHLGAIEEGAHLRFAKLDPAHLELLTERIATDLDLVAAIFELNRLLEPLSCDRISKMIVTVQACLYAALTIISHVSTAETAATAAAATEAATEATKQQQGGGGSYEQERAIAEIVAKSLALYSSLFEIFRQSNRVAGQICQNAHMFTAWLLFSGMQLLLNSSRQQQQQAQSSGAAAVSLQQQRQLRGTSGLANPLAKHALKLMASLLDDLHLEFGDQSTRAIFGSEESDEASGDSLDELNFLKKFSFTCPAAAAGTSSTTATTAAPGTLEQSGSSSSVASGGTLSPSASQTGLGGSGSGSQTTSKATFKYNKFGHYSAWQRIEMIVSSQLNVIQLLFSYLSTGYRRACLIRTTSLASAASVAAAAAAAAAASEGSSGSAHAEESADAELGETASTGGSRNFSIEDLYTILLGEAYRNSGQHHHQQHQEQEESLKQTTSTAAASSVLAELRREADSHYGLVIAILDHLNYYYICSKIDALQAFFKQMLTDGQLIALAHIIQDLDAELEGGGGGSVGHGQQQSSSARRLSYPVLSTKTFARFSGALTSLMHNLIAMQILSEEQQNSLLAYLGFKPCPEVEGCTWKLYHGARSLAILAQVILLRQQREKEEIKLDLNSITIQIWRGFVNQLKGCSLRWKGDTSPHNEECPVYYEDLNVEHAQLMLFLFHNLKLLQRKHVFYLVGLALHEISAELNSNGSGSSSTASPPKVRAVSAAQILFIGRLLHLFEYMCKNLYDTPAYLFEQINHNLLSGNQTPPALAAAAAALGSDGPGGATGDEVDDDTATVAKIELEECLRAEKSVDSLRSALFFADKRLECNYFNYILANKDDDEEGEGCGEESALLGPGGRSGGGGNGGGVSSNLGSSNSSFNSSSLTASSTHVNAAASTAASTTGGGGGGGMGLNGSSVGGGGGLTAAAAAAAVAAVAANSPNATNTSLSLQEFILHPRFYHLMDVGYLYGSSARSGSSSSSSSGSSFVPKLDGMACNFMLAGFPNLSYEAFYNSLLNLFQFLGHQYDVDLRSGGGGSNNNNHSNVSPDPAQPPVTITTSGSGSPNEASTAASSPAKPPRYPSLGPFGLCCLDYSFGTMWRLVNQLPPTLQSFTDITEKVESKNYDWSADGGRFNAAKLINMCIWIPRFENRAVYIWIRELLAKVNNSVAAQQQQLKSSAESADQNKVAPVNLDETMAELMTKFNSLQYNYRLFKTVVRTFYHFKVSNSKLSSMISSHSSDHLFSLPHVQFPKFFTLLAIDLFTERVMLLIRSEFTRSVAAIGGTVSEGGGASSSTTTSSKRSEKKGSKASKELLQQQQSTGDAILTPANAKSLSSDSQELIYEKFLPQMIGLFQKMYSDINTILIYDGPLNNSNNSSSSGSSPTRPCPGPPSRSPTTDLKYLFYRSLVNICSTNCFDTSMSDISANIVDFLPHTILLKIDQWNRIHANVERRAGQGPLHELISAGHPMEVPLVEVQSEGGGGSGGTGKNKNSNGSSAYVHHFSAFLSEKYSLSDFPTVSSIETGAGNIAWIKLKQYWFKLFKFAESIYWTKNYYMPSDPFVSQLMSMQLNLVSSSLTHGINESTGTTTVAYRILAKTFDLKADSNEMYCSALYPQFIRNAFFILTTLKNRAFTELAEEDQLKFQKVHQDCASEFFMFFARILKKTSGKVAFEEFLCDTTPTTPTAAQQQTTTTATSSPSTSTSASGTSASAATLTSFSFLDLIEVASHPFATAAYAVNLLKLLKTLLSQADKYPDDISIIRLCSGLSAALAEHPQRVAFLFNWLHMILFHRRASEDTVSTVAGRMEGVVVGVTTPMQTGEAAEPSSSTTATALSPVVYMSSEGESSSNSSTVYLLYKFVCYVIKDSSRFDETVLAALAEAMLPTARKLLSQSLYDNGGGAGGDARSNHFLSFAGLFTSLVLLMSAAGNSDHFVAAYGKPGGHLKLIDEVVSWLTLAKEYLSKKDVIQKIEKNVSFGRHQFILESSFQMLSYLSDIFNALEYKFVYLKSARRPVVSTDAEGEEKTTSSTAASSSSARLFVDDDIDEAGAAIGLGYGDDDYLDHNCYYGEEDEEDEELCEKLCTFTETQKEFINQHWYHCHTCKMLDGVGVCNVCAQVCHRGHDVTYSKHGSFFCDCGASEDGSCRALVRRQPKAQQRQPAKRAKRSTKGSTKKSAAAAASAVFASSKDRKKLMRISKYWYSALFAQDFKQWKLSDNYKASRAKFSSQIIADNYERFGLKYEHFENFINLLMTYVTPISETMLSLVEFFVPTLEDFYCQYSELGFLPRIRKDWALMHSGNLTTFVGVHPPPLRIEKCDGMLTQVKVSPDSVFENVQPQAESANHRNLSILAGAIIRRSSMLVLGASNTYNATSAALNPCLLLVAHDKNRISVVQLNLLLGQVYGSSRRKLSPKKLAAITFPFTVMTMAHNPLNDELIAVCGLKECHVLSLARTGSVTGHYSLMMTLDTNNYIIKALWLPNSQTELAIVTIEFIKIYDLSREDRDSPLYNFVIPSRKIRDMTFYTHEDSGSLRRFALVFSSRGQIYAQELTFDAMCDRERERVRAGGNAAPIAANAAGGDTSSAFYLTTVLNVNFPASWPTSAHQQAVSFSIYYSHLLGMLFVSYFSGESFCAPFSMINIFQQMINSVTSLELGARLTVSPATLSAAAPASLRVNFEPLIEGVAVRDPNAPDPNAGSAGGGQQTYVDQPPLLHWKELTTHPGLIFALTMNTQHTVCFMVRPNAIKVQEVKCKRKVFDYALISCTTNGGSGASTAATAPINKDISGGAVTAIGGPGPEKLTTVITLCEDGSLRFHKVCNEQTNYWLRPNFFNLDDDSYCLQPIAGSGGGGSSSRTAAGKKAKGYAKRGDGTASSIAASAGEASTSGASSASSYRSAPPRFPVDYFEHCTQMNDIEFGGADILEVYNTQQLKNRLSSANMYVACTKANGFSMTVTQVPATAAAGAGSSAGAAASSSAAAAAAAASGLVMAGIRVNLGVCDPTRAPTAIEIFNRSIPVAINRNRWFDIPFTRAEIAQVAETKTFSIRFAPSGDVNHVTIVDSVRVYGKPREALNLMPGEALDGGQLRDGAGDAREDLEQPHEMYADPFARRVARAMAGGSSSADRSSASTGGPKSPFPKLRLLLYSPTITEEDAVCSNAALSTSPQYQGIFVLNRLVANCLDVLESSFSFFKSLAEHQPPASGAIATARDAESSVMAKAARDLLHSSEYQAKADTALSIASKLLVISMSDRLDRSVCMLLARLLPSRAAYDEHRDEVIFESSVETMKHLAFDDIIVYYYNLALFREMVTERPRNFVRFVGKYFGSSACAEQAGVADMNSLSASDLAGASMQFSAYLSELFWRLYSQRPLSELLAPVTKVSLYENLETMVDSLVYLFYASMLASLTVCPVGHFGGGGTSSSSTTTTTTAAATSAATSAVHDPGNALGENQKANIRRTTGLIVQYLCSPDPQVSYSVKKALGRILLPNSNRVYLEKVAKQHQQPNGSGKHSSKSSTSGGTRERRHSARQPTTKMAPAPPTAASVGAVAGEGGGSSSASGASGAGALFRGGRGAAAIAGAGAAGGPLRRQGALRSYRGGVAAGAAGRAAPAGAAARAAAAGGANRADPFGLLMQAAGGRANANQAVVDAAADLLVYADQAAAAGANVFERVSAQLMDGDLEAYRNLLLNVPLLGEEFDEDVYLNDLFALNMAAAAAGGGGGGAGNAAGAAGAGGAAAAAQGVDEIDGGAVVHEDGNEAEDDDDDEDDDDEDDDDDDDDDDDEDGLVAVHLGGSGNRAGQQQQQPPLFPLMDDFADDAAVAAAAAAADDGEVEVAVVERAERVVASRSRRRQQLLDELGAREDDDGDDDQDGVNNDEDEDDDDDDDDDDDEDDDDDDDDEEEEDYEAMDEAEDAMVELAIALSLQESGQQGAAADGQQPPEQQEPPAAAGQAPAGPAARPRGAAAAANALRYLDDLNQDINAVEAAVAELNAAAAGRSAPPPQPPPLGVGGGGNLVGRARIVDGLSAEQRAAEREALEAARVAREERMRRERAELDLFLEQQAQLQAQQERLEREIQADYGMLHSESDDDEEYNVGMINFDEEMRSMGTGAASGTDNTTVESIEVEEDEEEQDDHHERRPMNSRGKRRSSGSLRSKSDESIKVPSGSPAQSGAGASSSQKASSSGASAASAAATALQKTLASPARHRKRLRKIITSKFCVYLLKQMSNCVNSVAELDGVQAIPFLQVLIMLADFKYQEHDRKEFGQVFSQLMQSLLTLMLNDLGSPIESSVSSPPEPASEASSLTTSFLRGGRRGPAAAVIAAFRHRIPRHPQNEVYIVILRLFSVFLSRFKHFPTALFFSGAIASTGAAGQAVTAASKDPNLSELFICPIGVIPAPPPPQTPSTSTSTGTTSTSGTSTTSSAATTASTTTPLLTSTLTATTTTTSTTTVATTSSSSKAVTFDEQSILKAGKGDAVVTEQQQAKEREKLSAASYSLLLTATQLVNSNDQLLTYCLAMLQNLLRSHWRPLHKMESENEEKNKAVVHGETIVYHSKKPIKIRPHLNFIPYDLKPFFMISQPGYLAGVDAAAGTSTASGTSTSSTSAAASTSSAATAAAAGGNPNDPSTSLNCSIFSNNVFDKYPELLTEMCLRLPYQLKKLIVTWQAHHATVAQKAAAAASASSATSAADDPAKPTPPQQTSFSTIPPMEFDNAWIEVLCEYMMLPSVAAYTRKQVRKLLAYLCGTKERYRQVRDYYSIKTHLRAVRRTIVNHFFDARNSVYALKLADLGLAEEDLEDEEQLDELIDVIITNAFVGRNVDEQSSSSSSSAASINVATSGEQHRLLNLPYHRLISLVDHLKACLEISTSRLANWQRLCRRELRILPFLFRISLLFGEGVSSIILQLISLALFTESKAGGEPLSNANNSFILNESKLNADLTGTSPPSAAELNMSALCRYVFGILDRGLLGQFIRAFLLESNSTQHRWAAHSLLYHFYQCLQPRQQEQLLALFWRLWPSLACYGKRGSQFVDLLGYFTLNTNRAIAGNTDTTTTSTASIASSPARVAEMERQYAEAAIGLLKHQNQMLAKHPNANIYNSLQSLLEFNGFYLETEPCLVCNNPEVNFVPVKLSAIKLDSRYTTYTHIVKMIGSHTISKIALKISELKKSKMVKTLTIYYNNRFVASVVELKNKSTVWQRAKRVNLALNQTEVKIDFALPIVACNLMIEYSAFYETTHSNTETLQCPRCSSIVPANPGVCTNCGENVFQCHKCRAINYDEKDPFLCNSCGFCKYAKFDYVLTARYTATAVETIENEEDRAKAVTTINSLLDKADKLYKTILAVRPSLEQLLLYSQDYNSTVYCLTDGGGASVGIDSIASAGTGGGPPAAGMPPSVSGGAASTVNGVPAVASTASAATSSSGGNFHVNRYIQQLAHRYCNDCRLHFDELSKIVQKVLYTRKELVDYDNRQAAGSRSNYEELKRLMAERRAMAAKLHQQQQLARGGGGGGVPLSASNCSLNQCPSLTSSTSSSSDSSSASTLVENVQTSTQSKSGLPRLLSSEDVVGETRRSRKRICSPETAVGRATADAVTEDAETTPAEPTTTPAVTTTTSAAPVVAEGGYKSGRCFGCSSATIEHCITLLKALAYTPRYKAILSSSSLFRELIDYNLRLGTGSFRAEIRSLLCLLTRDNAQATEEFNNLLLEKIKAAFQSHYMTSFDFGSIRHEMALLAASFDNEDSCWEQRLRCVMKLFLLSLQNKSPAVLEAITLPCLRILYGLIIKPKATGGGRGNADPEAADQAASVLAAPGLSSSFTTSPNITFDSLMVNVTVDLGQWLSGDPKASFAAWKRRNQRRPRRGQQQRFASPASAAADGSSGSDEQTTTTSTTSTNNRPAKYEDFLADKYFARWQYLWASGRLRHLQSESFAVRIASSSWIREVLFNPTSKALRVACRQLLMALFERLTNQQRVLVDLLTTFLDDLCAVGGETGLEYYDLYRSIIFSEFSPVVAAAKTAAAGKERASAQAEVLLKGGGGGLHWRYYLALTGLLQHLGRLITEEIARLKALEEATLSSDFGQGFALRQLVELLQIFMVDDRIRRVHKSAMVGVVLDGYLSLRMLIIQRTKMIDETQTALLELLELLTTGTRVETINFMKVCIESVRKCAIQDQRTPVFIFERLCSIIYPEEKDADEFFISLEKDPQQEDFLQGRMLGNPYSSKDPGMGPLMRDIKNKICQECELVSLLEDDSGLELLVNNKIISLDLAVKEVYKRIVQADSASTGSSGGTGSVASGVSSASWSSLASAAHLNLQSADIALIDSLAAGGGGFSLAQLVGGVGHGGGAALARGGGISGSAAGPTMKITYRIRGLMGDATEEFIESFANKESVVEDDEKRYELAAIMAEGVGGDGSSSTTSTTFCGLQVMLERFEAVEEITNRSRQLLFVLLKLFGYCVKVVANRRALISPQLNTIGAMLAIARLFVRSQAPDLLTTPSAPGAPSYFEQLLTLMETLMAEASRQEATAYDLFNATTCGTAEDVRLLMDAVTRFDSVLYSATVNSLTAKILRIVAFLALGNAEKAAALLAFFKPYFDFDAYDRKQLQLENPEHRFELLCSLLNGIERNKTGNRMKDLLIEEGFVPTTIEYLVRNAPPMKNFLLINNEEWKDFTSRPALKYVLRMLTGLSHGHENTQLLITRDAIPIIHGLEQVLTDSHMATLAENLMDAIKENPSVEAKIEEVRLKTREEKKRIAMAVREKQLGELGMRANDKGQVMADSQLLKAMEEQTAILGAAGSGEEKGLVCSICREGYQYSAQKVLAVYTFTKRCNVEEHEERRPRKTVGYTTVTHFNIIHVECHMSAVRHARTRDEWQSAALHNANTRCNGLLPLWGPQVYESLFAHALARHNSYLHDAVGQRDFTGSNSFLGTVHDLKLLLARFATESTFMSEETGGGGAQSNLYLTPYLAHTALYVMNTTKVAERERANLEANFFAQPSDRWIDSAFAADSPYFWAVMTLLLSSKTVWAERRLYVLRRLILTEHLRRLPADRRTAAALAERATEPVAYGTIKPAVMFFAMINLFYTVMFKSVETTDQDTDWSSALATYIRHNDQAMLEAADKMLELFESDLLLSTSFGEFADAADLLRGPGAIADPDAFLKDALRLPD